MLENKVTCLASLANAYLLAHQPAEALQTATEAMNLAGGLRTPRTLTAAYETMATVCQATGRFREAYHYRVRYEAVHDSLLRNQFREKLALYHTQYEVQRREEKIGLLQKNTYLLQSEARLQQRLAWALGGGLLLAAVLGIVGVQRYRYQRRAMVALTEKDATIAAVNADLRRALNDKDVLMREIHHGVKNNLQVIASLLGLQALENDQLPEVVEALQEGESRVKAMALIHELLYRDDHLSRVDFAHFLRQLLYYLGRTFALDADPSLPAADTYQLRFPIAEGGDHRTYAVTIDLQLTSVFLTPDVAVPLGLIANEIVINVFRHAFPGTRAGRLSITLKPGAAPDGYELRITDDGVGLPPDFDPASARSLVLRLVSKLARQLRADVGLHAAPEGNGTWFWLRFGEPMNRSSKEAPTELPPSPLSP